MKITVLRGYLIDRLPLTHMNKDVDLFDITVFVMCRVSPVVISNLCGG